MQLSIVKEIDIDASLDTRIKEGLSASFPDPEDVAAFVKSRAWHGSAPAWSVLVEHDNRVAAHVGIVDRTIRVGDEQVRVAGVQNVFVVPDHRGKGLSDEVMNAAMAETGRLDFDLGILFCVPQLEKVYARCGWVTISERPVIRIDETGREVPIPGKNIAMFYPLKQSAFPDGPIHLQGNDW